MFIDVDHMMYALHVCVFTLLSTCILNNKIHIQYIHNCSSIQKKWSPFIALLLREPSYILLLVSQWLAVVLFMQMKCSKEMPNLFAMFLFLIPLLTISKAFSFVVNLQLVFLLLLAIPLAIMSQRITSGQCMSRGYLTSLCIELTEGCHAYTKLLVV